MELSPKGDPPGFVAALDEKTRAFPDRPGNHWLDTFENLLSYPCVALVLAFLRAPMGGELPQRNGEVCA